MHLIVFVYSLNPNSLLFAHQRPMIEHLAKTYAKLTVIAADPVLGPPIPGASIVSSEWHAGRNLRNLINFYRCVFPLITRREKKLIFSHMTEVQSFLVAPLSWLLGVKHFLWYAHKSRSPYLYFSYPFISGIVTSTVGSCPIQKSKVFPIGQMIDTSFLPIAPVLPSPKRQKWYYIGRLDPSKRIEEIIESMEYCRRRGFELTLDIFGEPSSSKYLDYANSLRSRYSTIPYSVWVNFKGPLARIEYAEQISKYDGFIHAFRGSLDKTLVEACLAKKIVVSVNPEYLKVFSGLSSEKSSEPCLSRILLETLESPYSVIEQSVDDNYRVARESHTFETWIKRLLAILETK